MSNHRRIRPYAWLGAGAVTLGMGAAMVVGTGVAFADTGADSAAGASDSSASAASSTSSSTKNGAPTRNKSRASRVSVDAANGGNASPAASVRASRVALPAMAASTAFAPPDAGTAAAASAAPEEPVARPSRRGGIGVNRSTAGSRTAPVNAASAFPAAVPPDPGADPSYNMDSYLPSEPIVPGAHVTLALQQISAAQALLSQETFGSGNIAAGVVSIVPQLFLAEAAWSLSAWENNMPGASQAVAGTVGIPILHQLTQVNLLATMTLPALAEAGLTGAALLLPLVNLLGASTAATQALVVQARSDGKVYAVIPVQMKAVSEPVVGVSVNNGAANPMLVDTGASGLLLTRDSVGAGDLGAPVATGEISFSGAVSQTFRYTTYLTTVDFGGGAVTTPTAVNIVDEADAAAFKAFLEPAGVVGILGVGANTYGPGPDGYTIPTTSLPGELNNGFLLYQGAILGVFGFMIFGPNPLATRVSVPGAPDAYVTVSVNDGPQQIAYSIIDSGGVYGTLPAYLGGGTPGDLVPPGTKIAVYTEDGSTLLYSYTTNGANSPTVVDDGALMNTGYIPFQRGPVYINYAAPDRIGSTDFAIW